MRREGDRAAEPLLDFGAVPVAEHAVGRQAAVHFGEMRALGRRLAGARDARLRVDDDVGAEIDRLSDEELAPRLEALYHLAWAETYLEFYDDAIAHAERGVAIARAFGEGQLLVPLMLAKNFPFEMQGRLRDAIELCETVLEAARLSASPHELYRALFELGWTLYYAGDLDGAIAAHEESSRVDPRLAGATIPNGGGGPGWGLGVSWFEAGEIDRGRTLLLDLVGDDGASTMPVERCFDWESLTLVSLAVGDTEAANRYAGLAEEDAARLRCGYRPRSRDVAGRLCFSRPATLSTPPGWRTSRSCGRRGRSGIAGRLLSQPRGPCARGCRRA